jgi:hypothetical protein
VQCSHVAIRTRWYSFRSMCGARNAGGRQPYQRRDLIGWSRREFGQEANARMAGEGADADAAYLCSGAATLGASGEDIVTVCFVSGQCARRSEASGTVSSVPLPSEKSRDTMHANSLRSHRLGYCEGKLRRLLSPEPRSLPTFLQRAVHI